MLDGEDGVLLDQTVRFSGKRNEENYPPPYEGLSITLLTSDALSYITLTSVH